MQSTDTGDPNLYYGIVIDAGSSGTRVFVYFWPKHSGGANELLRIQQMRDEERNPVVKKIKPGELFTCNTGLVDLNHFDLNHWFKSQFKSIDFIIKISDLNQYFWFFLIMDKSKLFY